MGEGWDWRRCCPLVDAMGMLSLRASRDRDGKGSGPQ